MLISRTNPTTPSKGGPDWPSVHRKLAADLKQLEPAQPEGRSARQWAEVLKRRSTLAGLVEPLGIGVGYLTEPGETLEILSQGGAAILRGDLGGLGKSVEKLVDEGLNPSGAGSAIYNSALGIQALSGAAVGGLEVYAGVTEGDKYLSLMGGCDLLGAASNGALLADLNGAALGLSLASTVGRTGLVLANLEKFSRTQKVKTFLDAGGSVASSALKSGFLAVPSLAVAAVAAMGQIAYMNSEAVRGRVDKVLDKVFGPEAGNDPGE